MVDKFTSRAPFRGCNSNTDIFGKMNARQNNNVMGGCKEGCNSVCKGGCNNSNTRQNNTACKNDCKKLLERLREVDFSLVDTILYLDAYPHSCEALSYYNKLKEEREEIVKLLAMSCNKPMTAFDNYGDTWSWSDAPWPWEICAN